MAEPTDTPLFYTETGLERAGHRRGDEAWIAENLHGRDSRILPVWQGLNLIRPAKTDADAPEMVAITGAHARGLLQIAGEVAFLGIEAETGAPYFAADLSAHPPESLSPIVGQAGFSNLREVAMAMDARDAGLLAFARGVLHWHARHRYCGDCGAATTAREGGWVRICADDACGVRHFPRTDPAVIVLVTRPGPEGGACLLGRQAAWPQGMMSTLAGFVEPGETAEDAVRREIMEEAGVEIGTVTYLGSQPWAFPGSLMLAYRAEAKSVRITLNDGELEEARWFTRAQIETMEERGYKRPRSDSIARWMIDGWVSERTS